jgi:hypothetical protein
MTVTCVRRVGREEGKRKRERTELTLYTSSIITEREPGCLLSTGMMDSYSGVPNSCTVPLHHVE